MPTPLFVSVSRCDLRPLQRRCVVLHIDNVIYRSLSQGKRAGHIGAPPTPASQPPSMPPMYSDISARRYFNNIVPPTMV